MTEALDVKADHIVLEIGTGSGYQTAILSRLCNHVYSIERYKNLLKKAQTRFETLGLENISRKWGDGALGWPEYAPFDRILISAACLEIPEKLIQQLRPGGRLIAPIGDRDDQWIARVTKSDCSSRDDKMFRNEKLIPVRFVPMLSGLVE